MNFFDNIDPEIDYHVEDSIDFNKELIEKWLNDYI